MDTTARPRVVVVGNGLAGSALAQACVDAGTLPAWCRQPVQGIEACWFWPVHPLVNGADGWCLQRHSPWLVGRRPWLS